MKNKIYNRKKIMVLACACILALFLLSIRIIYIMVFEAEYYSEKAQDLHERERSIKAARGDIIDATGVPLAINRTVCTISVIHNQIENPEKVIEMLALELAIEEDTVRKRVEKYSSIEKIKSNVPKEIGDKIRDYEYAGVKIDEDYKRYYPYDSLASKVLGFTGGDNQGIIGLEVIYEEYLTGKAGTILTVTDAKGVEISEKGESRIEPVKGNDLAISMDINIQKYATQLAMQTLEQKQAESVSLIVMNPQTGELLAMVNAPEFNLNDPFTLPENFIGEEEDALNIMWRNGCISDTYEPGSAFKIITAAASLEEEVVTLEDTFHCPGYVVVEDRRMRCHKVQGHGSETFLDGFMVSCNPVFVNIGLRVGIDGFYDYFEKFGLLTPTNVDLPGEANTIMHQKDNMGLVELATVSFGQSFQITPIQLATTVSSIINGGNRITPHFGMKTLDENGKTVKEFKYPIQEDIVSEETSETMKYMLEEVIENGGGKKAAVEGFSIGGKTATSETLPRGTGKYIASFVGFAPAEDPTVLAILIINNPVGTYYGGQIAAPVVKELFENILPYLDKIE